MDYRNAIDINAKAKKFINNLEKQVFIIDHPVDDFELIELATNQSTKAKIGSSFSGRNDYYVLNAKTYIPQKEEGNIPSLSLNFGKTHHGFNGGFESLFKINGDIICAVDTYHNCIQVPDEYHGQEVDLCFELWTGFEGGGYPQELKHEIQKFDVGFQDIKKRELLFKLRAISDIYDQPGLNFELQVDYFKILQDFIIDYQKGVDNSDILSNLDKNLSRLDKHERVTLNMFGHAHIDLAWLWTLENGVEKTIRTLSTVLKYCDEYPNFRFIHSSPQIFNHLRIYHEDFFTKVQKAVQNKQIEIEGAMWVEADCNLPSGESLSKQLLYGKDFIRKYFNHESKVLWLPDVFGYSWAMPQLLKLSGVDTFMTTKISWNKFNKMPTETFMWRGIDGTDVFTHFMTTPEPKSKHWNKTYTALIKAQLLNDTWETYEDKLINNSLPVAYGYGDGGGGPSFEMIEAIDIYNELPGVPKLNHTSLSEAVEALKSSVDSDNISVWDGELYLEYHRGTFTTQGAIKKYNKILEVELKKIEQLLVLNKRYDLHNRVKEIWQEVLLLQFHDIIPGSSLHEVNQEANVSYEKLLQLIQDIKTEILKDSKTLNVYNHHTNHEDGLVTSYKTTDKYLMFYDGQEKLSSHYFDGAHHILINHIKSLSSKVITLKKEEFNSTLLKPGQILDTKLYSINFDEFGVITSLYDRKNNIELSNGFLNKLVVYDDFPVNFDAWDFDVDYQLTKSYPELTSDIIVQKNDDLNTIIYMTLKFNQSLIKQQVVVYHTIGSIMFNHNVDWHEENKLLRSISNTGIRNNYYSAGIQYGDIKRSNTNNTKWDIAQFEICAHNYVDISQTNRGMSLISPFKYGYNCDGEQLGISLLRSPKYPDHLADMGEHSYSYSLYPHDNCFEQSDVKNVAYKQAHKIDIGYKEFEFEMSGLLDGLPLNNKNIEISSIGYAHNSNNVIIRLADVSGGEQVLGFKDDDMAIRFVTIDEQPLSEFKSSNFEYKLKPYEVITLEVKNDN